MPSGSSRLRGNLLKRSFGELAKRIRFVVRGTGCPAHRARGRQTQHPRGHTCMTECVAARAVDGRGFWYDTGAAEVVPTTGAVQATM